MHKQMTDAYLEAAEWASTGTMPDAPEDTEPKPLDTLDHEGWSDDARKAAERACAAFAARCAEQNIDLTCYDPARVGHDLWFTRNGHGAGFWDRPEVYDGVMTVRELAQKVAPISERLTDIANAMGERDVYIGDDLHLYFYGGGDE